VRLVVCLLMLESYLSLVVHSRDATHTHLRGGGEMKDETGQFFLGAKLFIHRVGKIFWTK
jgi:hypothetical protein